MFTVYAITFSNYLLTCFNFCSAQVEISAARTREASPNKQEQRENPETNAERADTDEEEQGKVDETVEGRHCQEQEVGVKETAGDHQVTARKTETGNLKGAIDLGVSVALERL